MLSWLAAINIALLWSQGILVDKQVKGRLEYKDFKSVRGADGGFFGLTLDDHQRDVVGGPRTLRKFRER